MKKKVCHVISGYIRDNARIFQRQCISLSNAGFKVSILTNDGQPEEIMDGVNVYCTKITFKSRLLTLLFAKYQFLKRAIEIDADIYQLHSPELIPLGVALKKIGKIVIYDAHEDLPRHILEKEWLPKFTRGIISKIVEYYMNISLKKLNEIISPHSHVVKELSRLNPNTTLITNFPIINWNYKILLEEYLAREKIICYTGTVYEYSNQDMILKALNDLPQILYKSVGYISQSQLLKLSKIDSFKRVEFGDLIPYSKMKSFYESAIIGLVIYDYKLNLGNRLGSYGTNKIFEYMEAGLPFICTDYVLWNEIVTKYNCGICVQPGNLTQIRDAIHFLYANPTLAYQMGQNGRRAVESEYNWGLEEKKYISLFNKYVS
jgi:glycosyltransferase involved in cell wall biosynthesis